MVVLTTAAAEAGSTTVSGSNANVLNLLSPFLSLNSTATGQTTLTDNLAEAVTVNNSASTSVIDTAISDVNLLSSKSNTVTGLAGTYGVAANLGGGLAAQTAVNGYTPSQSVGGLGVQLGAIYESGVNAYAAGTSAALANTVTLLTTAYGYTSSDLGVAKYYFANGTVNGTSTAVAPSGYTLPTYNGLPNTSTSVYDNAYDVSNTGTGQNIYGDSRPYQVSSSIIQWDPAAASGSAGINGNPSFPSGHTNYAYTDSILLGMLVPQEYESMLSRAAEYGNSRIVVGVHYPLDIVASRSFASYDLAQYLSNSSYINNASTTGTAVNLPSQFTAAQSELTSYLSSNCGASVSTCASSSANTTNDPYAVSAANLAAYTAELTYGLPTLSYAAAPREAAPAGSSDASILLATIYGGSSSAAQTLAPNGGLYGNLSTATINQILVNTETNAIAAFYGTALSYWARLNLYYAADYFSDAVGVVTFASTDQLNEAVTIGSTGVLVDNGAITGATTVQSGGVLGGTGSVTGNVSVQSGGALSPGGFTAAGVASSAGTLAINGNLTFASGSSYNVEVGSTASKTNVSGTATLGGAAVTAGVISGATLQKQYTILTAGSVSGTFSGATLSGAPASVTSALSYDAKDAYLNLSLSASAAGASGANQVAVVNAFNNALNANGSLSTGYANVTGAALSQATGEVGAAAHNAPALQIGAFLGSFFEGGLSDPGTPAHGGAETALFYAGPKLPTHKSPAVAALPTPFTPYWTVWSQTFGGTERIGGSASVGSTTTTNDDVAELIGVEYRLARDTAIGFGVAAGTDYFSLNNGLGSGHYNFGEGAVYAIHSFDPLYVSGALALSHGGVKTSRTDPTGASLQSSFDATAISGRLEIGGKYGKPAEGVISPYAALQLTHVSLPSYSESGASGFALSYASQDVNDTKSEIGVRFSRDFGQGAQVFTLGGQFAWAHDFDPKPVANASFLALPSSSFSVTGAAPAANSLIAKVGAKANLGNGWALEGSVEGQFAANVRAIGGKATISYSW